MILQKIVKLYGIGVQLLHLIVVRIFFGQLDLEADDVTVLNLTLRKGSLKLELLNHTGLDLFKHLNLCRWRPAHKLVDSRDQVAHLHVSLHVHSRDTQQALPRRVKVLEENHNRIVPSHRIQVRHGQTVGVQNFHKEAQVVLTRCHAIPDHFQRETRIVFRYDCIRTHRLVLAVDQNPQPHYLLRQLKVVRESRLEAHKWLVLKHSESRQVRGAPYAVVKRGKIKALVGAE